MNSLASAGATSFLGRLVDKSLGRADVVEPRLPSLFEPVAQGDAAFGPLAQDESAEPTEELHVAASSARIRSRAPRAESSWETEPAEEQTSAPGSDEAGRSPPALAPVAASPLRPPDHVALREVAGQGAFAAETDRSPPPFATEQERPVATVEKQVVIPSPRPLAVSKPANESAVAKRIDGAVLRRLRSERGDRQEAVQGVAAADRSSRDPVMGAGALLPQGHAAAYATPGMLSPPRESRATVEQPSTSLSAPVINVTIGRVEVRAVQQSLAGKAHTGSRSAPPLSLGDYLHRREGRE